MTNDNQNTEPLPLIAQDYITSIIKKMRYRRRIRNEVRQELTDHFTDALADCQNESQRNDLAQKLITDFGDPKHLAKLIRRSKKRCRPWWRKAFSQTCKAILVLWVITIPYNFWTIHSWRANSGNYLEKFNALNRPNVESVQNAWPDYQKAHDSFVESPKELAAIMSKCSSEPIDFDDLSTEQMKILKQWLLDNDLTWSHIVNATNLEYYWWDLHGFLNGPDGNDNEIMEHTKLFRPIAKMGRLRALYQAEHGQTELSLQNCIIIVKMGFHLSQSTTMLEHMIGVAILSLGEKTIITIVNEQDIENQLLMETQEELRELYRNGRFGFDPQGEYLYALGNIGNALGLTNATSFWKSLFPGHFFLIGNRNAIENKVIPFFDQIGSNTPYELHVSVEEKIEENVRFPIPVFLINSLVPAIERISEIDFRVRALHEATLTILALKRWHAEKDEYPQQLEELVAGGLLEVLPDDPYSAGPLVYERRGEDFVLYSVGADFDDDGGIETPDNPWGQNEEGGDHLFWPVK